jgi:hypothetical protein
MRIGDMTRIDRTKYDAVIAVLVLLDKHAEGGLMTVNPKVEFSEEAIDMFDDNNDHVLSTQLVRRSSLAADERGLLPSSAGEEWIRKMSKYISAKGVFISLCVHRDKYNTKMIMARLHKRDAEDDDPEADEFYATDPLMVDIIASKADRLLGALTIINTIHDELLNLHNKKPEEVAQVYRESQQPTVLEAQ